MPALSYVVIRAGFVDTQSVPHTPVIGDVGLKYVRQSDVLLGVQMQIWDDKKESSLSIVMSILFPLFM